MTYEAFDRVAFPGVMLVFVAVGLVLPSVRLRRRTGATALVFQRGVGGHQRAVGLVFMACVSSLALWSFCFAALGPDRLGVWAAPLALRWAGYSLVAAGFVLLVLAERDMGASWRIGIDDRATPLVTEGLFRFVRNPVFSAMLVILTGGVLVAPSWFSVCALAATALLVGMQARLEERHLLTTHGDAYRAYAARVGRFVPGVGRLN